jgi:hypothetical protein
LQEALALARELHLAGEEREIEAVLQGGFL